MSEVHPPADHRPKKRMIPPPFLMTSASGESVDLAGYGDAVAQIVAQRSSRDQFDYRGSTSHARPVPLMRQIVWAHLRFGAPDEMQPTWVAVARLVNRDHATVMYGARRLLGSIEHDRRCDAFAAVIFSDVTAQWPQTQNILMRMKEWAGNK